MALEELLQRLSGIHKLDPTKSDDWATGHGILGVLTTELGHYAHVIDPDLSSVRTPISSDPQEALEGAVTYGEALMGYSIEGDDHVAANGVLNAHADRPSVMILNTTGVLAKSSCDSTATAGTHWVSCVALPAHYTTPGGVAINNPRPRVFYLDSYYEGRAMPAALRHVMLNGARVRTVVGSVHVVPAAYPNAEVVDRLSIKQQLGGSDCGFWAVYNALMLVLTGSVDFTGVFRERSRDLASRLRTAFPGLVVQAPLGDDKPTYKSERQPESTGKPTSGESAPLKLPRSGLKLDSVQLEPLEFKPGQPVYYIEGKAHRKGFVNTAGIQGYRVRLPQVGKIPNEVVFTDASALFPRVGADALDKSPQIAVPGVTHLGPSRPIAKQPTIHRSESEIELVGSRPYIRLYMTVPRACPLKDVDVAARSANAAFKDVQQQAGTGVLLVATGANRGLWIGAGRPLRAAKWAQKYIAEHANKAEESALIAERLENQIRATEKDLSSGPGFKDKELEQLSKKKNLTRGESKRLTLRSRQVEEHDKKLRQREALIPQQRAEVKQARDEAAVWRNPLVRAFLCELSVFEDVVRNAIPEELAKKHPDAIAFNVDRHYEPNQYNIEGAGLVRVRAALLDHSLITYAYDPELVDPTTSGEIRDVRELWCRLGIPERQIDVAVWTENTGFADKKNFGGIADMLSMYYGTWLESLALEKDREPSVFVSEHKAQIPFYRRLEMLNNFLEAYAIQGTRETTRFMEDVVGPWATQAEIARLIAEDYDRIELDQNIKKTASRTDFAALREREPYDRAQLAILGSQVEHMLGDTGMSAARIRRALDFLIDNRPELRARYAKISAIGQNYSFYVHAQMVLGQFFAVTADDRDQRLLPRALVAKAILFHDMEKVNSKLQYGKEGEHHLTVVEMRRYRYFLGSTDEEWNRAIRLVDADPFGDYFKGKIAEQEAFLQINRIARAMQFRSPDEWARFFVEYHQFYQSDFSSYTSASHYFDEHGTWCRGQAVFDPWFVMRGERIQLDGPRFVYSNKDDYEKKYLALAQLFKDPKDMLERAVRLERAARDQELARRASKLSDRQQPRRSQ